VNALNAKDQPVPLLDFSRSYAPLRDEILAAVTEALDSQRFILGQPVADFEKAAAAQIKANFAVGCASGTDALWLALAAAEIGPGDSVITTPFSFFASVSAILRAGATPLLADIDPVTFNLSPEAVEGVLATKSVTHNIKAVMPVHLYGQCTYWDEFTAIANAFNLTLLEDAAQAWGAKWNGRAAGTLGKAAAFSFYPTKNLSAAGDAGMVTTMDESIAERAAMLRNHGMRRRYFHDEIGWNSRLDTLQAAILLIKLRHVEAGNQRRRELATNYARLFAEAGLLEPGPYPSKGVFLPIEVSGAYHVWHQYVIRTTRRNDLRAFLTERQIGSEIYYPMSLHQQEALASLGYHKGDFPESERAANEVLALPIFPELREDEQETVVSAIADFLS
jgi:dTDP-4-amino-4,6-dideoxygalactose transaminase